MTRPQQKKHFNGRLSSFASQNPPCGRPDFFPVHGVSIRPQPVFSYPKGHPCHGCPYTFRTYKPSCIMGGRPGDCAWYFYRRLTGQPKPAPPTVNYTEIKAIDDCIEMLYRVAERKFGKEYAEKLRQRRFSTL